MKHLRRYIRNIIIENYELTKDDIQRYKAHAYYNSGLSDDFIKQIADLRGLGIQGPSQIARDKEAMRQWHNLMKQNPEFVSQFTKGKIQILHSITYGGYHSDKADMDGRGGKTPFTDWVKRFGIRSRDQISCVAANAPIGTDPSIKEWAIEDGNVQSVFTTGYGFLMKGYPAFVAEEDLMTQTLSALSKSLKDFNLPSGQVKRAGSIKYAIDPDNWQGSEEVILDNWQIIGVYFAEDYLSYDLESSYIYQDAQKIGVPIYKTNTWNGVMTKI